MDLLGACIGLGVLAFAGGGVLLGWLAFMRVGQLERRLAEIERELESRRQVRGERAPAATPSAATADAADAPVAASRAVAPTQPQTLAQPQPFARSEPLAPPHAQQPPHAHAQQPNLAPPIAPAPDSAAPRAPAPPPPVPHARPELPPAIPPVFASASSMPNAPASTPERTAPAPRPAAKPFDLERWLGVRGAAVLGGVFLAIAGFLFLQHSIERGWITPTARVIAATIGGIACFVVSFPLRSRGYAITGSALAGAGAVILYAASWAASMLYGLVSPFVAFAAMGAVTATCVYVAWKHGTQLVAVLGLVGGFATPLVLSTGQDRPFGLFGYVLLLDLAFLFLAGRRRWPAIGLVALAGTTLIQGLWVARHMDPGESWIGLGMLGLFALTFAGFATTRAPSERTSWIPAQAGAVLLPFAFVLYFAQELSLAIPLGALALLAALLCAAASVLSRRDATPWLPVGAASGSIALLFTWTAAQRADFDAGTSWLVAGCALGLALLLHAFAEWRRADGSITPGAVAGAAVLAMGALVLAGYTALDRGAQHPWPWIVCFGVLALLLQRQSAIADRIELAWIGACGAGAGLALRRFAALETLELGRDVPILVAIGAIGALLLLAVNRRRSAARERAFAAVTGYFVLAMLACCDPRILPGIPFLDEKALAVGAVLVLSVGALIAATGARSGACYFAAGLVAFVVQAAHVGPEELAGEPQWTTYLALLAATTILYGAWSLATRERWRASELALCTAALQPLAWIGPIAALVEARHGHTFDFLTPLVFAVGSALYAVAVWRDAEQSGDGARRVQRRARIAATLAALLLASSVVPVQVDRQVAALTLAIFGACACGFWTRMDSLAVKWIGTLSIVASTAWLALFSEPWHFVVPPRPIANVHAWLYLVPAACAVFAATRLRAREIERMRAFEIQLTGGKRPIGAGLAGFAAVALIFVWINVEISGLFAIGERVGIHEPHERGRALATSLGWAVYALVLLALGVKRRSSGPRWASLLLFLATIGKVFLFDLGHLEGLQRAASMLGLALSLIVVSLVYQRFVFRRAPTTGESVAPAP